MRNLGEVTAQFFKVSDFQRAVELKEARGGIMRRTHIRMSGVDWPHYEVRFIPPPDPSTLPWHLTHDVRGDEGWAS